MTVKQHHKQISGSWRMACAAVWLVGIAVIAINGWWFPGILVVAAVSLAFRAVVAQLSPAA